MIFHSDQQPVGSEQSRRALEIINAWIDYAATSYGGRPRMGKHLAEFWAVRDILEGVLKLGEEREKQAAAFIRDNCKPSADQTILIEELKSRGLL